MANAILGRCPASLGDILAPPSLVMPSGLTPNNYLTATVTSSLWCGTGVQILGPTDNGAIITLPGTNLTTKLGFNKCIIVNLKPSVIDARCELYTPFIHLERADSYDDVPEWAEVECFWNPVRKTYQTVIPCELKGNILGAATFVQGLQVHWNDGDGATINWKFQKPTFTRAGLLSGLRCNETIDNSGKSTYTWSILQSDAPYRSYPSTVSEKLTKMIQSFVLSTDLTFLNNVEFPSCAAKQLTVLQIYSCIAEDNTEWDLQADTNADAFIMIKSERAAYLDTLL